MFYLTVNVNNQVKRREDENEPCTFSGLCALREVHRFVVFTVVSGSPA